MSDEADVRPALSEKEWAARHVDQRLEIRLEPHSGHLSVGDWGAMQSVNFKPEDLPALIALANAALPDDDARKITWAWVDLLRSTAESVDGEWGSGKGDDPHSLELCAMADVLAFYLPPRE